MEGSGRGRSGHRGRGGSPAGGGRRGRGGQSQYHQQSQHRGGGDSYHGSGSRGGRGGSGGGYGGRPGGGGGGGYGGGGSRGSSSTSNEPPYSRQFQQGSSYQGGDGGGGRGRGAGYGDRGSSYQNPWDLGSEAGRWDPHYGQSSGQTGTDPDTAGTSLGGRREVRGSSSSGRGKEQASVPIQIMSSPEPVPDSVHSEVQVVGPSRKSPPLSDPRSTDKILPVKRPDIGRNFVRPCRLLVNHYRVRFNPETIIMHYDVDIKAEKMSDTHCPRKVSKSDLGMIRNKLLSDDAWHPMLMTGYDGEKNIFSVEPLPTGSFRVELSEEEDVRKRSFVLTIKLVNELKVCKLKDYLSGKLPFSPRDILQGMDLVMKENPTRRMISVGRCFFPEHFYPDDDLGRGIAAYRGFQHSLKPTSQGLALCLDYSVLAFRKREPVIDFLYEHVPGFNLRKFGSFRREVEDALRGLKVFVTHRRTKQKYTIAGLTIEDTRSISFTAEDPEGVAAPREISLLDYFMDKYEREIMEKDIPCLNLGKNNRKNYVPMEFCVLCEGQRYPKEHLDRNAGKLLKNISLALPNDRKRFIQGIVESNDGPCGGGLAENFGMEIDVNMTAVKGRVIGPPDLKLGALGGRMSRVKVDPEKCQWNLVRRSLVEGRQLDRWAVLDFSASERDNRSRLNPNRFIPALISRCRELGIQMEEPLFYERSRMSMLSNVPRLYELLKGASEDVECNGGGRLQLLLCVMSGRDPGYKHLKWISETQIGIVTQCCLAEAANMAKDQTLANLALKINAKLGGSNSELVDQFPRFEGESHIMFVGADVNHPGAMSVTSRSVAAVVATMNWPAANRYAARVCPQTRRMEKIANFGEMCADLVNAYATVNGVKPAKIVVFRDGVSESQFGMVLNEELMDLKRAIQTKNYSPTITLIVARKRHQTRLFPGRREDGGATGNVPPGTVVDTDIVHPFEFDFYLCSHYGSMGTSKSTHYHVLWDEHQFTSDQLQQLIYNLCFTFARCTKSVSLVPPVYYADLVAYRGQLYQEALMEGAHSLPSGMGSLSLTESPAVGLMYRVHGDIENAMFFV